MGIMDELRKLTQPYDDENDVFEGADENSFGRPTVEVSPAQKSFEDSFASEGTPEPAQRKAPQKPAQTDGSIFGNLGKKGARPRSARERTVNFGGNEAQVILFNPKTFDEAGELVSHINQNRSVVMTLEGLPNDTARRLLDFLSGITFALQGKITPISAKTYFVSPQNVDLLGAQTEQPESDGQYL